MVSVTSHRLPKGLMFLILVGATMLTSCFPELSREYDVSEEELSFRPHPDMDISLIQSSLTVTHNVPHAPLRQPDYPPIKWTQQQFLEVSEAFLTHDLKAEAELSWLFFDVSCEDVDYGPQKMSPIYYQPGIYQGQEAQLKIYIVVDAQAGYLSKSITAFVPATTSDVQVVDWEAKIPAEKILPLAEQAGGSSYRKSHENQCLIQGTLSDNEWNVHYTISLNELYDKLDLWFDAGTGKLLRTEQPRPQPTLQR